jgi:hypothetical protein
VIKGAVFKLAALSVAAAIALPFGSANAIIILNDTWIEEGGGKGHEADGFSAHYALAHEPQFDGVVALYEGASHIASGTWIGNDAEHGYIITAGHVFDGGGIDGDWSAVAQDNERYDVVDVWIHEGYDEFDNNTLGFDMAVMTLARPVEGLGEPAMLYCGSEELGQTATFVGYGYVGIGSSGEQMMFQLGIERAAGRNVIDLAPPLDANVDPNTLITDFDRELGARNALGSSGSAATPVDRMEAALGSGDSGGSIWIETPEGWAIVGMNSAGGRGYGGMDWFSRVSTQRDLILAQFPGARFGGAAGGCPASSEDGKPQISGKG